MSDKKTPPPKKSKPRRRRRRLMRWLFFIALILSLLIGIVQGPVLRKIATDLIRKQLHAAGFEGSFVVDGSLFSGLELRAVHLTSNSYIQELHADRLRVDYKLTELLKGNIEEVVGEDIDIWIELSPPALTTQAPVVKDASAPLPPTEINLEDIRHKVLPIKFLLNRCSVGISREKKWLWRANNISLTHRQNAEDFHLSLGLFVDMDEVELEHQEILLTWSENFTSLKNFPIRAKAILTHLRCRWDQTTPKHLEALVNWQQGLFMLQLDDLKKAKVELSNGEIDLDIITPWIGLEGEMGGEITALQASVADIMATPDTMDANLKIEGQKFYWKDKKINHLQINTTVKNGQVNLTSSTSLTTNETIDLKAAGQLSSEASSDWLTCWHGAKTQFDIKIPQPAEIASLSEIPPPIGGWPNGAIHLSGDAHLIESELGDIKAQLLWNTPNWANLEWEKLTLHTTWNQASQKATAKLKLTELKLTESQGATITAQGNYSFDSEQYQGELSIQSLDIATLLPALDLFKLTTPRAGNINLNWSGQGLGIDLPSYQGKLDTQIKGLDIQGKGHPPIDITLQGHYAKNLEVNINKLQIDRDNIHFHSAGNWKNNQLHLTQLELLDNELFLIKGQAKIPLSNELNDLDEFLKQPGELDIDLHVKDLPLAEIYEELPETIERKVRGNLSLDLTVKGTLLEPNLQLQTEAKRIQLIGYKDVPAANISLKLSAQNNAVTLDSNIKPDGYKAISLKGEMPYNPKTWIDDPNAIMMETIDIALDTPSINLAPFSKFLPHISKIDGSLTASAQVTGTIDQPVITGKSRLKVSRVDSTKESIPDLRDLNIAINYDHEKLTIEPSSCFVAGGKYNIKGTIGMEEITNPLFDISLTADKALIWRDDSIIVRADANLSLKGPYEKAHLQGEIGIVESLFYKDIQIIPIGGESSTSSQPAKVELPDFTRAKNKKPGEASIPAPFDQWTIDLRIRTKDDLLIRGNIAKGNVSGNLTIKGSFKEPQPTGRVFLNDAQASLPFSRLHVKEGKIIFSPKHGFDPEISIKATSKIGPNEVDITLYGLASSPKTLMTSSPPLPENEIIFLLATGSTSDKINDGGAVTGKAYQLLVDSMLRSSPGKFKKLKQTLTELNQKVNINIGASDPFTGRKYNSASVELHDKWYVIASADLDNHTRGLLVFAVRFK